MADSRGTFVGAACALIVALACAAQAHGAGAPGTSAPRSPLAITDDWGRVVSLRSRPTRIVSLAPHATELLFAAGAGASVVAVDPHSDHPQAARALARVASHPAPDRERLLALRPDLVVLWGAATSQDAIARLEALGLRVFVSEPRTLPAIADGIERFARLAPDPSAGLDRAARLRARLASLRERYRDRTPVPVFVQAWAKPLLTLSDRDTIGDALRTCGALNVFGQAPVAAPQVGAEAVLAAAPRLIVSIDEAGDRSGWDAIGVLAPRGRIAFARIPASIQRPTGRMLDAVEQLCEAVDALR